MSLCSETIIHSSCAVIFLAINIIELSLAWFSMKLFAYGGNAGSGSGKKPLVFRTCCVMLPFGEEAFVVCTEGNKAGLPGCFLPG